MRYAQDYSAVGYQDIPPCHTLHTESIRRIGGHLKYPNVGDQSLFIYRGDINNKVRRLRTNPREDDCERVVALRTELAIQFDVLAALERKLGVEAQTVQNVEDTIDVTHFNALETEHEAIDESDLPADTVTSATDHILSERRAINFPSNIILPPGPDVNDNSMYKYRSEELNHRVRRADTLLARIRDAIAAKSFQYSHIQHPATTKAVLTRSRATNAKITHSIVLLAKLYTANHRRLLLLLTGEKVLQRYKVLQTADVRASTAIIDPNEPGSKSLRLSWIWTMDAVDPNTPGGLTECESTFMDANMFVLSVY